MHFDPTGHFGFTFITTVVGAIVGTVSGIVDYATGTKEFNAENVVNSILTVIGENF